MTSLPFSWLWRDPAETIDRLRAMKARMAKAEQEMKERERRIKARRIKRLTKLAMAGQLKGR